MKRSQQNDIADKRMEWRKRVDWRRAGKWNKWTCSCHVPLRLPLTSTIFEESGGRGNRGKRGGDWREIGGKKADMLVSCAATVTIILYLFLLRKHFFGRKEGGDQRERRKSGHARVMYHCYIRSYSGELLQKEREGEKWTCSHHVPLLLRLFLFSRDVGGGEKKEGREKGE